MKQKENYFLQVWIADREWGHYVQTYKRDYWYDSVTGKPSSEGKENAVLKCIKGDQKLDKEGKPVVKYWASKKVRFFHEDYRESNQRFYDVIEAIFIRIKNTIKNRLDVKRLFVDVYEKYDKVHLYREIASLQYYIQQRCYSEILDQFEWQRWEYDVGRNELQKSVDIRDPYGKVAKEIVKIFYKYRNRINKGSFTDDEGVEYSLFKKVTYQDALLNVKRLRETFKKDLLSLITQ